VVRQSDPSHHTGRAWIVLIPTPDRFESNPTLANGVWIVATMPSRIQSDLEAVSIVTLLANDLSKSRKLKPRTAAWYPKASGSLN
jgi:hypothetical protein